MAVLFLLLLMLLVLLLVLNVWWCVEYCSSAVLMDASENSLDHGWLLSSYVVECACVYEYCRTNSQVILQLGSKISNQKLCGCVCSGRCF
jgi:hypothetical protein